MSLDCTQTDKKLDKTMCFSTRFHFQSPDGKLIVPRSHPYGQNIWENHVYFNSVPVHGHGLSHQPHGLSIHFQHHHSHRRRLDTLLTRITHNTNNDSHMERRLAKSKFPSHGKISPTCETRRSPRDVPSARPTWHGPSGRL